MDPSWIQWPASALFLFLCLKAYGYLRDQHGSDGGSWLEGFGAFYLAPIAAPFMPFIWLHQWSEKRRETAQIASGGGPLTSAQRTERKNVVIGAGLVLVVVAVALYVLVNQA